MNGPKMGLELVLELVAENAKIENRENPTFRQKLDFFVFLGIFCKIGNDNSGAVTLKP